MNCYNCNATEATPILMCPSTSQCGKCFDPKCMKWDRSCQNAAYLNKIFSAHEAEGSSLFYNLNTATDPDNFTAVYNLIPCSGCGCCCCCDSTVLGPDAVFEIQKIYSQLDCLMVTADDGPNPVPITPAQVTINGFEVEDVTFSNGLYTATIGNVINNILNPQCIAQGLPSKAFLLLQNIGPLAFRARMAFEGVVRAGGKMYRFKLYLANNEATPLTGAMTTSSFAVAEANIPCIANGMVPVVTFSFGGRLNVINPTLTVEYVNPDIPAEGINILLNATLSINPTAHVEVLRNTLMLLNGAQAQEDLTCGLQGFDLYGNNACCCNNSATVSGNAATGVVRCGCGCNG